MKRINKYIVWLVLCAVLLAGCSSGYVSEYEPNYGFASDTAMDASNSGLSGVLNSFASISQSTSSKSGSGVVNTPDHSSGDSVEIDDSNIQDGSQINKDMLVYKGAVSISTKEYESAIESLNNLYSTYDCFIEYSREYSNYRYSDESSLMTYEATIRVNSKDYIAFMDGASSLGVVSSKSSNVQNMNVEYSDTVTALSIQTARMQRYLKRLETEEDNEIAMQLEREITSIQIEIQQLEARKSLIETDVAYSYVDLTIREVKAYTSQVTYQDPLHVRIWAEIVNTYYEFTEFLVNVLFTLIHLFPYLMILVIVIVILRKRVKFRLHLPKLERKQRKNVPIDKPTDESLNIKIDDTDK